MNVFDLEKHLIPPNKWYYHREKLDPNVLQDLENCLIDPWSSGGNMGLGYTEDTGYYVLFSGQGPGVAWMEKPCAVDGPYPFDGKKYDYPEIKPIELYLSEQEATEIETI
jgi:hypothetical protein